MIFSKDPICFFRKINIHSFNMNYRMKNWRLVSCERQIFVWNYCMINLVGYTPLITMNSAHHMLTFACANPGSNKQIWLEFFSFVCVIEMNSLLGHRVKHVMAMNKWLFMDGLEMHRQWHYRMVCLILIKILRNDQRFAIVDVGFPVGRNTPYKYIVVNIHYLSTVTNDKSGNQLIMSRKP